MRTLPLRLTMPPGEAAAARRQMARRLLQSGEPVDDVAAAVATTFKMRRATALQIVHEQQRRL